MVRVLEIIKKMEEYAEEYNVPIMQKDTIEYINRKIVQFNLNNILEIGTAIGYSAINMASSLDSVKVTSIERDENRYKEAIKNIEECGYNEKIKLIFDDALNVNLTEKYNLIIIDAAKGKNIDFLNKFKSNLMTDGYIIIDNTKFHGLVGNSSSIKSKNLRRLVEKIEESIEYLKVQDEFYVEFIDVGDGLAVCTKK